MVQIDVHAISSLISVITVLSCMFLKLPQIIHIKETRSVDGISLFALLMEVVGYTVVTLYNYTNQYSLMTYLEYPIILVQIYMMVYYALKLKQLLRKPFVIATILAYFILILTFAIGVVPKLILSYLLPFCSPISGSAKVMYIYAIIKAGNAEAVSLITWYMSILTNLSRIYTVYMDSGDDKLIFNFIVSAFMSGAVFFTAFCYQWKQATSNVRRQPRVVHLHND